MNVTHISLPYVYPLCPLNFNHAKMFVVADVYARYYAQKRKETLVIFPIASHFSGNTAQSTADMIREYIKGEKSEKTINVYNLHRSFYGTPHVAVEEFVDSNYLMNYYHNEIIWELKNLHVSCDYENAYTTQDPLFAVFVKTILGVYRKNGLLVLNNNHEMAVNYDECTWREKTLELIQNTAIFQEYHKKGIISAFNNLSSEWEMLRFNGYGVAFGETGSLIDPMFDSELFMIFDLFVFWRNHYDVTISDAEVFFDTLVCSLKNNEIVANNLSDNEVLLIQKIINSLPCDFFFAEEHLKNWIGKKFFAEQLILAPELRTKEYRILGMGMLENQRMSASRGHSILARNLILEYGGTVSRLVILMSGGNISRHYNYEIGLPEMAKNTLNQFVNYWLFINSNYIGGDSVSPLESYIKNIDALIEEGYLRKAITELLVIIPKKNKRPNSEGKRILTELYKKYIPIFIPELKL